MTVSELIEALKECDGELKVYVRDESGDSHELDVRDIYQDKPWLDEFTQANFEAVILSVL